MAARLLVVILLLGGCFLVPTVHVECSDLRPCPAGQLCDPDTSTCWDLEEPQEENDPGVGACMGECQPCRAHADCPSLVCDLYSATDTGGSCVPVGAVVYVDNRNGTCQMSGTGETPDSALCTVAEGLSRAAAAGRRAVRVMASDRSYGAVTIGGRGVALYGPAGEGGRAQLGGVAGTDAVSVAAGSHVVIDGFDITRGEVGVSCAGAEADTDLVLRRSRIMSHADLGVLVNDCRLELDRVLLTGNGKGALAVGGSRDYRITNSFIVKNRSTALPAVKIGSSGAGTFRFNTVADNSSTLGAGIDCGGQPLRISDSIVVRNERVSGSQFQNGCQVRNTAVGYGEPQGIRLWPNFTTVNGVEYGIRGEDSFTRMCCIDRAEGSAPTDYFGTRRPRGARADIGAHEAK